MEILSNSQVKRAGYQDDTGIIELDRMVDRNRISRLMILGVAVLLTTAIPTVSGGLLGAHLGSVFWGHVLGFLVGGTVLSQYIHRFFVIVPHAQAFVTQDIFTGRMIPYGPGLHAAFPWEHRIETGNVSLKITTQLLEIAVPTKTSEVIVFVAFQYKGWLKRIVNIMGVDDSTIRDGLASIIQQYLTAELTKLDTHKIVNSEEVQKLNDGLAAEFGKIADTYLPVTTPAGFTFKYGIQTVSIVINKIALPIAVQKTRDALAEADNILEIVSRAFAMDTTELKEKLQQGKITLPEYRNMLNYAFAASGNADMKINILGGDASVAMAAGLASFLEKSEQPRGG